MKREQRKKKERRDESEDRRGGDRRGEERRNRERRVGNRRRQDCPTCNSILNPRGYCLKCKVRVIKIRSLG